MSALGNGRWIKLDFKLPYDWENETVPADGEIQVGGYISDNFGIYVDGKFGIGSDRMYDWGAASALLRSVSVVGCDNKLEPWTGISGYVGRIGVHLICQPSIGPS